ncbi:MAG: hypothetical protein OEY91_03170 [Nitrospirota bacterium]|nr:hypothetical protein [Nitrospirota bacterium]
MPNCLNTFSTTDIHILETGLGWIKEDQERFANNFYHRLLEKPLAINVFLQSMGPWSFSRHLFRSLDSMITELREHGEMITPLMDLWPELSSSPMSPTELSEMITVAETFLDLVSELAEDAWSPVLEYAWRKAIKTVMSTLVRPGTDPSISFFRSNCTVFPFFKGKASVMDQPRMLCLGPIMLMAGGIAAFGLWMRCHFVETRSKTKTPLQFSVSS